MTPDRPIQGTPGPLDDPFNLNAWRGRARYAMRTHPLFTNPVGYATTARPGGAGLASVLTGIGELSEGNPVGALVGTGAGLATAGLTNRLMGGLATTASRFLPGPVRAPVMLAGKFLLPYMAGEAVTRGVANTIQGAPQAASDAANAAAGIPAGLLGLGNIIDQIPGTADINTPFFQGTRVRQAKQREFERRETQKDYDLQLQYQNRYADAEQRRALAQIAAVSQINRQDMQAQKNIALELSRQNAIQGQALLNTQGAISQGLLRTQGAFQLAGIGMQTGASIANTFLATSPYARAVQAAPNVNISL